MTELAVHPDSVLTASGPIGFADQPAPAQERGLT